MSLFSFFKRNTSAPVARERLQVLLAHERTIVGGGESDLVAILREEIMAVIAKHMAVPQDNVQIKMDRGASVSTLEVDIEIPSDIAAGMRPAA
ncbi:cell division topological specificity factor MinE [Microvirga calopogonii]|uniref:cell division topological specificity factor MinE n=1 Tax=Microvirga calopogonii TaxID=2078013 RepID=UPI000E0DF551|nr:cell division topological specificity factor MinE [Microvirga calopogonii]